MRIAPNKPHPFGLSEVEAQAEHLPFEVAQGEWRFEFKGSE